MRILYLLIILTLTLFSGTSLAQDFSNKGKDFYLCFPQHVPSSNNATLSIFITSDKASSGTITMPNGAFSGTFNIPANGIQQVQIAWSTNIHISNAESSNGVTNQILKKSIRIKVDAGKPAVVAYAQQWAGARTAATLLLPVNVLGKKYHAVSFTQSGSSPNISRSQFQVIATKDNTVVTITPRKNGQVGTPFTVTFPLAGDMIQYQSADGNAAVQDLTGTYIESVASGSGGCLPIAVFSGSSNVTIGTSTCTGSSSDPLWQQLYPVSTWGKNFGFVPFLDYPNGNPYRVMASEDNTKVTFDGAQVATLNAGEIYPSAFTPNPVTLTAPTSISADRPICVTQYAQADICSGQPGPASGRVGDPDMVILNPIEQNIRDITIFSSSQQVITRQYINILLKTIATGSFTINGAVPGTAWQPFPTLPGYSFLRHQLPGAGSYRLTADSGFNAVCYGWGNVESYAYSAGTNVKDLYQQIGVQSQYGIEPTPSVCKGSQFKFKVSLPYCADSIKWDLSFLPGPPVQPATVLYNSCSVGAGGPDSTTVVNGITLYWYSLPTNYTFNVVGSFPVSITTYSPNTAGCGGEQDIDFELTVYDGPAPDFTFVNGGCVAEPVQFTDVTTTPRPSYLWNWDFGDPGSGASNTSTLQNPSHTFSAPGTYTVSFYTITTPGCISNTITKEVVVKPLPSGSVSGTATVCLNTSPGPDITFTGIDGTLPYTFTYNINGGASQTIQTTGTNTSVTLQAPTSVAGVFRYNLVKVTNTGSTLCTQNVTNVFAEITVTSNPIVNLTSPAPTANQTVCEGAAITDITYSITGATGGTVTGLPTGVNGVYSGGIVTISGTPAAGTAGTYNYSVAATGGCSAMAVTGTITVNPSHTLTLTSAPSTTNQTVCINIAIVPITYTIGGGGTNVTVAGLPAGITASVSGNTVTITGAPTTALGSPFNYTVTTSGNGCAIATLTGTITVTVPQTLTLSSAPSTTNQTVCLNVTITPITYTLGGGASGASVTGLPAGVTGSLTGSVFTISGTPTTAVGSPFNYSITTTGSSCIGAPANGMITVNPDHTLTLSSAPATPIQTVCINTTIVSIAYNLGGSATGANVVGLPPGVTSSVAGTTLTISGSPTTVTGSPFSYSITTTGNSCQTASAAGTITVNPAETITLSSAGSTTNQTVCMNTSITSITYTLGGGATGASVTGLPAGVTSSVTGTTLTISGTPTTAVGSPFNYSITTTGNGCSPVSANGMITVNPNHLVTLTSAGASNNQSVCINIAIVTITYDLGGGATAATVTGLPPGVTSSVSGTTITISGTPTTVTGSPFNYSITTTGNNCTIATATGTIAVNAGQTVILSSGASTNNQSVCMNTAITPITYSLGGSASGATVTGLPGGVTSSVTGTTLTISGTPTTMTGSPFSYSITTTGTNCQPATTNGTITVTPVHAITLSSPVSTANQSVCMNAPITSIIYSLSGGATGATVTGLPAGVTGSVTGTTLTISGTPTTGAGSPFNYSITTTGNTCLTASLTGTIAVSEIPSADFNFAVPGCATRTVTFTDISVSNTGVVNSWQWNFNDPSSGAANTSALQNPTHVFATAGVYNVTLSVINDNGCASTVFTKPVTINARPVAAFTPPVICVADVVAPFTDASTISSGTIVAWEWNFGDPNATGSNPNTSTLQNPNHFYTVAGIYTVQQVAISNSGCRDTTTRTFTVNGIPVAGFTVQNSTSLCSNQDVTITDGSSVNFGSLIQIEIFWDYANNPTIKTVDNTPTAGEVYTHTYPEFGSPLSRTYDIRYIAYSGTNCINTFTRTITVLATPTLQFDAVLPICSDVPSFQITQARLLNTLPGAGVFSGTGVSPTGLFNPATAGGGLHTIRYTYTGANGCTNYKEQVIEVYPTPVVSAGPDKVVLEGGVVALTPTVTVNAPITYAWTPSTGLNNPAAASPLASPPVDITYTLMVTTDKGCSASDQVFVKLLKKPAIPNIFSPNGDGIHDKWDIAFLESYPGCTIDIFNRYGQLVYHSVGYITPWDGKVNGKDVPVGTYYYIVDPKNGREKMSGYLDIIR